MKYAIDRKFENTKEHNVIFYDMGSTSVKSSFVTFSAYDVLDGKKNKTVGARLLPAPLQIVSGHSADRNLRRCPQRASR